LSRRQGLEELFARFGAAPMLCSLGVVTAVDTHADYADLVDIELQPSLTPVQARVLRWGVTPTGGAYWPVVVGDHCLVFFPDGDHQNAVALVGLNSATAPAPTSWTNEAPLVVHPSGTTFATSETAVIVALVTEAILAPLQASLTEISAGLAAFGLPVTNTTTLVGQLPTLFRSVGVVSE